MTRKAAGPATTPKEATERLGRAFEVGDPGLAEGALAFPYLHAVDFRGKTTVHVYDAARFAEQVSERPGGPGVRRTRTDLTVETLSPTAALVREEAMLTAADGDSGLLRGVHLVVRGPAGWAVNASWYSELPEELLS